MQYSRPAILALADGSIFHGYAFGAEGHAVAEVVFNTSMTGYQEILTDPSYFGQIVTLTYPHIGNTGVNPEDTESKRAQATGLIVRDYAAHMSNFRATQSLAEYLQQNNIVAITGVDTRRLTRLIREKGTQVGCILVGTDEQKALELARAYSQEENQELASRVTTNQNYEWSQGPWVLGQGFEMADSHDKHVVVVDFGVKESILRQLVASRCKVTVVPDQSTDDEIQALNPYDFLLSIDLVNNAICYSDLESVEVL